MKFGQYMKELFSDAGSYIPSGKQLGAYALSGTMLLNSGCHRKRDRNAVVQPAPDYHGLEIGESLHPSDAWVVNEESPHTGRVERSYVFARFGSTADVPGEAADPDAGKSRPASIIIFYASSAKQAQDMAYRLEALDSLGYALEVKNLEKGGFRILQNGECAYLTDNDDITVSKPALTGPNPPLPKPKPKKQSAAPASPTVVNNYYHTIEKQKEIHYIHDRPKVEINNYPHQPRSNCR